MAHPFLQNLPDTTGRDSEESVGEAKFVHLWQEKDGAWKITRVISYDHHALPK